jgi:hypothetical protein
MYQSYERDHRCYLLAPYFSPSAGAGVAGALVEGFSM